ncbi:MAG: class B sortase [Eubacteriales bacterium]
MNKQKNNKKSISKNSVLLNLLIVILIGVFFFALWQLYTIYSDYKKGTDVYESLIDLAVMESTPMLKEITTDEDMTIESADTSSSYADYFIDFELLTSINSDIIGWIRFDAPEIINYPILQSDDNDTYLHTNIYGEYNSSGCIFMDASNTSDFSDDNTIIYGHNMKNDSMFGSLSAYQSEDFYKEYPYFYIYTPDSIATKYQLVAVSEVSITDTTRYTQNFSSTEIFDSYIDTLIKTSYYNTNTPIDTNSSIITLSTCTASDNMRFIVQGVKQDLF